MNEDDLRQLDEILALDADDPRRREALRSPRMRSLLREYEEFIGGEAAARGGTRVGRRSTVRSRAPRLARWVALAASIAVIGIGLRVVFTPDPAPQYRSADPSPEIELHLALRADGAVELSWAPIAGATALRLEVVGSDLAERGEIALALVPPVRVDLGRFGPLEELAVRLVAEGAEGELARSSLRTIPTP